MGQVLIRVVPPGTGEVLVERKDHHPLLHGDDDNNEEQDCPSESSVNFPDLTHLPPELALSILSHLNATDLCLAECVWQQLASDQILWQGLCKQEWPQATIYNRLDEINRRGISFKKIFLLLDEGTLTFNSDADKGMQYFFRHGLIENNPMAIARFFHHTKKLSKSRMRFYLQKRQDVVDCMIELQNYTNQFLPNALRMCFAKLEAPNDRGQYLHELLTAFSKRFCRCNPHLGYSEDSIYVMCFSLILLSVDLGSPHVKNKMSKREFIRNTRNALTDHVQMQRCDDLFGEMYDNIYLRGHVSHSNQAGVRQQHNFVPGYLALFL